MFRLDVLRHGPVSRFWLGAARSGIAWLGPAGFGTAVVATCDKVRLGWQGWAVRVRPVAVSQGRAWSGLAVMEGRGLIGVRKSKRSW